MNEVITSILSAFGITGCVTSVSELSGGHINLSLRIDVRDRCGTVSSFVLQKINKMVFRDPEALMQNIDTVCRHLEAKNDHCYLRYLTAENGKLYVDTSEGSWRLAPYIESVPYSSLACPQAVRSAGRAYGAFLKDLSDLDPSLLSVTIPSFHDTRLRYAQLEAAIHADPLDRLKEIRHETVTLLSLKEQACKLSRLGLPIRTTHNDTKFANILFDPVTKEAITVIDYDTVMPGLIAFDFGDAIRSSCAKPSKNGEISFDRDTFEAFCDAFLSQTRSFLTDAETATLADGAFSMTVEQAVRYATDYLLADQYFRPVYPTENLIKARKNLAFAMMIDNHLGSMRQYIDQLAKVEN